jgi:hypothetical protein
MIDYTLFYKKSLAPHGSLGEGDDWHIFVSAFTSAERVRRVFDNVVARRKRWIVFPEYDYRRAELPAEDFFLDQASNEAEYTQSFWDSLGERVNGQNVCVDTTGFIRPYLIFLLRWFLENGVRRFDALYSEPVHYRRREETRFSDECVREVRQVAGYEGNHRPDISNDVLLINAGYDHQLIAHVAESKDHARKAQMFGFPSLRADMYQENVLRARQAEEAVGSQSTPYFAPANDPFVTASVLRDVVRQLDDRRPVTNLYLSPLATKPQVLGFALYYLTELRGSASSIIFPFCDSYDRETGTGVARVWKYTVELPSP